MTSLPVRLRSPSGMHVGFGSWVVGCGWPLLFLLAMAVQVAFLILLPARYHVNNNENYWASYKPVAENIVNGNGLVDADRNFAVNYPPGYPAVIAAAFVVANRIHLSRKHALDAFNVLITTLACLVLFLTTRETFGKKIGWLSGLLWISYLPILWTLVRPNTETPFILLLFCSVWVFLRAMKMKSAGSAFLVGVTLGLAALVRPIGVFLPLMLAVLALFFGAMARKNRIVIASLIVAGFLISVAPWEVYVLSKTGQLVLLCTNGPGSMNDGLDFALQRSPEDQPMWAPAAAVAVMERATSQRNDRATTGSVFSFAWQEATTHPLGFAELLLLKLYRPWYGTATKRKEWAILSLQMLYMPLAVGGLIWGRTHYREQTLAMIVFVSVIVYFWAMAFLVLPIFRYLVPAFGYVIIFVAVALNALAARVRLAAQQKPLLTSH